MNAPDLEALRAAYEATSYEVELDSGIATIRIGHPLPVAVESLLESHDERFAAVLTGFNPRSEPLDAEQNARRHYDLLQWLYTRGLALRAGSARDPSGTWSPERSVLAVGLEPDEALAVAERFEQYAYVEIVFGDPARVVYTAHWPGG